MEIMNIEEIAREKNIVPYIISPRNDEYLGRLQAFAAAVIKAHTEELIEGAGGPLAYMYPDDHERMTETETYCNVFSVPCGSPTHGLTSVHLYTATQVATTVAKAKQERDKELIESVGEPAHHIMVDGQCIGYYSATQVAGAVAKANAEVEQLRVQLAGCGVAAMQNTEKSKSQRAVKGDYGYSESYADVCRAVDREIEHRERIAELESERDMWKATAEATVDFEKSQMRLRIESLEAARMAYAKEFALNADGEPDVGNIHANIRAMKDALKVALKALEQHGTPYLHHGPEYGEAIIQCKEVLHVE